MEKLIILLMVIGLCYSLPVPGHLPDDPFCSGKTNGNYEYPAPHCSYFYQCVDGLTYVQECYSKDLYYNETSDQCNWAYLFPEEKQAECRAAPVSAIKSRHVRDVSNNFCKGKVDGNYEHPAPDCHKYYACVHGYTYVMSCPSKGLYYNPANDQCDWPQNLPESRQAECEGREYTGGEGGEVPSTTTTTTQPPNIEELDPFCLDKPNGNYEYPAPNCSLYYSCVHGITYVMHCATDDLYYDQARDLCDWPWNFPEEKREECGDAGRYTHDGEGAAPTGNPPVGGSPSDDPFCEEKADGNYEYPAPNCSLYYACSNGLTYIMECGEGGLYYNQSSDKCEWSWSFPEDKQAECEGEDYPGALHAVPYSGVVESDSFCADKTDGNYEYPAPDCSLFYTCANQLTYVMKCHPSKLYYNKEEDACDWPGNLSEERQRECQGQTPESTSAPEIEARLKRNVAEDKEFEFGVDLI